VTPLSIPFANRIYRDASQCEIIRKSVDHASLADLSKSIRWLVQSVGEEVDDEFWRRTLTPIRRTAFALCSTPIPFAQLAAAIGTDWNQLERLIKQSKSLYPDFYELLHRVWRELTQLLLEDSTPLIEPLEDFIQQQTTISVVLRNPRMNRMVVDYFARNRILRKAKVVSVSQLRGPHHSTALAVIGPCSWFPEYVFSAPRATIIQVVSYRWIRDEWRPGPRFLHEAESHKPARQTHRLGAMPTIRIENVGDVPTLEDLSPAEILPPVPVFSGDRFAHSPTTSPDNEDIVPARLCHLGGNHAVFVAADDSASSLIIDASDAEHVTVRRVPVDDLEQGMYLLLRTAGGGDFIAPLADRLLGESAVKRRSQQAEWKELLSRRAIERFGLMNRRDLSSLVCSHLQSQGLPNLRSANIHYWMSSKCIRPRKSEHFAAILTFAGLKERVEEIGSAMMEIDRSHRKAGHLIRQMLLQKIAGASLETLERDGQMDFELADQNGGSLSAFQVVDVPSQKYDIASDRIGVLLDLEE
jgi:hypothetical protein